MKRILIILTTALLSTCCAMGAKQLAVSCGDWIEISAKPYEDFHFWKWSDGDTNSIRQIQVNEDLHYKAYFASNCADYANIPILEYYDWLLMLDVRTLRDQEHYVFGEKNVQWYRVVGEPDNMQEQFPLDDQLVCSGYYLTIDRNLWTTGDYYAVVDVAASPSGVLCHGFMRSVIVHFSGNKPAQRLAITPSYTTPGQQLKIIGLDPRVSTTICVYDMIGRLLLNQTSQDQTTFFLRSAHTPGCYNVVVSWSNQQQTLRYLVNNH